MLDDKCSQMKIQWLQFVSTKRQSREVSLSGSCWHFCCHLRRPCAGVCDGNLQRALAKGTCDRYLRQVLVTGSCRDSCRHFCCHLRRPCAGVCDRNLRRAVVKGSCEGHLRRALVCLRRALVTGTRDGDLCSHLHSHLQ